MSSRARHHGSTAVLSPRRPRRTCVRRAPRVPPRVDLQTLHSEHERILMTRRGWRRVGGARPGWQQIQAHDLGQSNCRASLWIMWVPSRSQRQKRRHRALQPASPCHNLCLLCLQSRRSIDVLLRTTFLCKHLHDILELVVEMLLGGIQSGALKRALTEASSFRNSDGRGGSWPRVASASPRHQLGQ